MATGRLRQRRKAGGPSKESFGGFQRSANVSYFDALANTPFAQRFFSRAAAQTPAVGSLSPKSPRKGVFDRSAHSGWRREVSPEIESSSSLLTGSGFRQRLLVIGSLFCLSLLLFSACHSVAGWVSALALYVSGCICLISASVMFLKAAVDLVGGWLRGDSLLTEQRVASGGAVKRRSPVRSTSQKRDVDITSAHMTEFVGDTRQRSVDKRFGGAAQLAGLSAEQRLERVTRQSMQSTTKQPSMAVSSMERATGGPAHGQWTTDGLWHGGSPQRRKVTDKRAVIDSHSLERRLQETGRLPTAKPLATPFAAHSFALPSTVGTERGHRQMSRDISDGSHSFGSGYLRPLTLADMNSTPISQLLKSSNGFTPASVLAERSRRPIEVSEHRETSVDSMITQPTGRRLSPPTRSRTQGFAATYRSTQMDVDSPESARQRELRGGGHMSAATGVHSADNFGGRFVGSGHGYDGGFGKMRGGNLLDSGRMDGRRDSYDAFGRSQSGGSSQQQGYGQLTRGSVTMAAMSPVSGDIRRNASGGSMHRESGFSPFSRRREIDAMRKRKESERKRRDVGGLDAAQIRSWNAFLSTAADRLRKELRIESLIHHWSHNAKQYLLNEVGKRFCHALDSSNAAIGEVIERMKEVYPSQRHDFNSLRTVEDRVSFFLGNEQAFVSAAKQMQRPQIYNLWQSRKHLDEALTKIGGEKAERRLRQLVGGATAFDWRRDAQLLFELFTQHMDDLLCPATLFSARHTLEATAPETVEPQSLRRVEDVSLCKVTQSAGDLALPYYFVAFDRRRLGVAGEKTDVWLPPPGEKNLFQCVALFCAFVQRYLGGTLSAKDLNAHCNLLKFILHS